MAKSRKRPSGGAQLKAAGKTGILVGVAESDLMLLDEACRAEGRTRTNFLIFHALSAAKKILKNLSKSA